MKRKTFAFLIVAIICLSAMTFSASCVKRAENAETENGIRYSANVRYNDEGYFSFVENFWINFYRGQFQEGFNAIKLVYSSKEPMHIFVTYSFSDNASLKKTAFLCGTPIKNVKNNNYFFYYSSYCWTCVGQGDL